MKWAIIQRHHINTDMVQSFHWIEGFLFIRFPDKESVRFRDPDRKHYLKLCQTLGVRPVEVDSDGEI